MAKRKLPPHIVLPNGQWRFVKRGRATGKTGGRRVVSMARRKGYRRSRGGAGIGGLLKPLVIGGVVGFAQAKFAPQIVPAQGLVMGGLSSYAMGGRQLPKIGAGAVGGLLGAKFAGGQPTSIGGIAFY